MTYAQGRALGLDNAVPERYRYYGIPVALSASEGLKGYIAYERVQRLFANQKDIATILDTDVPPTLAAIRHAAETQPEKVFFVPADDKGDVTFTKVAFVLFGVHPRSLYLMYFVLLGVSALAFVVAFFCRADRLLVGVFVSVSILWMSAAFREHYFLPYVVNLYDPRVVGAVALLALFHVGFAMVDSGPRSVVRLACVMVQALVIAFAIHLRFDNVWMLAALLAWTLAAVRMRSGALRWDSAIDTVPVTIVFLLFAGLLVWERVTYAPKYFTENMPHHLVWHNVGLGFVLHPRFARMFDYPASDQAMMNRVASFLSAKGDTDSIKEIFGGAYSEGQAGVTPSTVDVGRFLNSPGSDIAKYDAAARRWVLETVRTFPFDAVTLFAYYKPRFLAAHLLWFTGLSSSPPKLEPSGYQTPLFGVRAAAARNRDSSRLIAATCTGILTVAMVLGGPWSRQSSIEGFLAGFTCFAFSAIPMLCSYPAPFLVGVNLCSFVIAISVTCALLVSLLWTNVENAPVLGYRAGFDDRVV